MEKAIVAMSGGVDSTVGAALLKAAGYDVCGVTLRLYAPGDEINQAHSCCSNRDIEDAKTAAAALGIEHMVVEYGSEFRREVIDRFADGYLCGETPNPCILCNGHIKFKEILRIADRQNAGFASTGHYVRTAYDKGSGRWLLKKGLDPIKDQSYVLYMLSQEQLSRLLFPVGELTKQEVRKAAQDMHLLNFEKPDSQDICFVQDGDYQGFIERYRKIRCRPGNFVDTAGNVLGRHNGIIGYTTGQRRGLGVSAAQPLYVLSKNMADNTITLGANSQLFSNSLTARETNWIAVDGLRAPMRVEAKIRYSQKTAPALVTPLENGRVHVQFETPQRAITAGQAVVFYDGDTVIGGGIIEPGPSGA